MYKIYINGNALLLTDTESVTGQKSTQQRLVAPYSGKTKMLLSYIDMLEKTDRFDEIVLYHEKPKVILKDLESLFKIVKAAGGVVQEETGKLLMIFRRGHWDLPKGKMDPGEKKKAAAMREVEEETGVKDLFISSKVMTTWHSFKHKSEVRALKKTYWYAMHTHKQKLIPQLEEDIVKAEWMDLESAMKTAKPIYENIMDILVEFKAQKEAMANPSGIA